MSGLWFTVGAAFLKEGICYDNVDQVKRPEGRVELRAD